MNLEAQELSQADVLAEQEGIVTELLKSNLRGVWD
jgi:hypothetical protein